MASTPLWDDLYPWPALGEGALHGLAGDVVRALTPQTEADPAAMLLDLLASFGNAVGDGPHARVGGARHPARLFVCIVGRTARSRKGQSHADVQVIFAAADPQWHANACVSGLASGEGLIAKLGGQGEHAAEKRVLAYEPEFSRVLGAAQRRGSTLSEILRQAWDTGDLHVLTRSNPLVAKGAHVGVIAHTTEKELRARLTSTEIANGFANRFLFGSAKRSHLLPNGGTLDDAQLSGFTERLRDTLQWARAQGRLFRSPKADKLWGRIYCEELGESETDNGLVGDVLARVEAQILRLSLVYALLDKSPTINTQHIRAGLAVWRYCEESARRIFGDALGNDVADHLLRELRDVYPKGLDFSQQSKAFGRHVQHSLLRAARDLLESRGLAETRSHPTGGRPRFETCAVPRTREGRSHDAK